MARVALVTGGTRGIGAAISTALTAAGRIFARRAAAAQADLERARRDLGRGRAMPAGPVSLGLSPGSHAAILPKLLAPFQERFGVCLRIVEGAFAALEPQLRDGALDAYIGPVEPTSADGLTADKLCDVAMIVVARIGHPLAGAGSLSELSEARWIAGSALDLDRFFERHGLAAPALAVEAAPGLNMVGALAASDALMLSSADWLPLIEATGLLTRIRLGGEDAVSGTYLVTRTDAVPTPAAAWLCDRMRRKVEPA